MQTRSALLALTTAILVTAIVAQNEIVETNFSSDPEYPSRGGWFDTARNALAGPAGQVAVHMAKEMISRQTGNSQVNIIS